MPAARAGGEAILTPRRGHAPCSDPSDPERRRRARGPVPRQASLNSTGFRGEGLNVFKNNIATANLVGFDLLDGVVVEGNAVSGNAFGIRVNSAFFGQIDKNNIVGSKQCGFQNVVPFLVATNNYWGAATGPGVNPADDICNAPGTTTLFTPFATRPFIVNAPINP